MKSAANASKVCRNQSASVKDDAVVVHLAIQDNNDEWMVSHKPYRFKLLLLDLVVLYGKVVVGRSTL